MLCLNEFQSAAATGESVIVGWGDPAKQQEIQLKNNRTPLSAAPDQGFRQPVSFVRLAGYLRRGTHRSPVGTEVSASLLGDFRSARDTAGGSPHDLERRSRSFPAERKF